MLQYLKRQAMKLRSGLTKGIVLLLCLATLFSSAQLGGLALIAEAAEGEHSVLYAGKATTSVTLPQDDAHPHRGGKKGRHLCLAALC